MNLKAILATAYVLFTIIFFIVIENNHYADMTRKDGEIFGLKWQNENLNRHYRSTNLYLETMNLQEDFRVWSIGVQNE